MPNRPGVPITSLIPRFLPCLILLTAAQGAGGESAMHFANADDMAKQEGEPWLRDYREAVSAFQQGEDVPDAIAEFNYLAHNGSGAAALRLCAIYAFGIKNEVNPMSGLFWCGKAYQAGYPPARMIRQQLFLEYWREYEG